MHLSKFSVKFHHYLQVKPLYSTFGPSGPGAPGIPLGPCKPVGPISPLSPGIPRSPWGRRRVHVNLKLFNLTIFTLFDKLSLTYPWSNLSHSTKLSRNTLDGGNRGNFLYDF